MDTQADIQPKLSGQEMAKRAMLAISDKYDADIILINYPIQPELAAGLIDDLELVEEKERNVFVVLVTLGGSADAAYSIGRALQRCYKKITICISGPCYSAGTLIVLCAHELVMGNRGELGPVDVQLVKKDEIIGRLSGLTVRRALDEMRDQAAETFVSIVFKLLSNFSPNISFKTALEISSTVTSSLFGEVYKQIDPNRIGDDARSLSVAKHYGDKLSKGCNNVRPETVDKLVQEYPAHETIIDRKEAEELFYNVSCPDNEEKHLLMLMGKDAYDPSIEKGLGIFTWEKLHAQKGNDSENPNGQNCDTGIQPSDGEAENRNADESGSEPLSDGGTGAAGEDPTTTT